MSPLNLSDPIVRQSIDTIRLLAADAVEKANSGHPGTPMEAAPIAYLLYMRHLRHNPTNPDWAGRDRFVLSCGHASSLIYSMLHLTGYDLSLDDIKNFRQFGSKTAGHPEFGHTPGVETTTGPLGQGVSVAVGMAMGGQYLSEHVDAQLFDYRTWVICSDGDLMEGVSAEAGSLAGHLQLGHLNYIYLDNKITIEGATSLAFTEDVGTRYLAYGWHVERVEGENLLEIDAAMERAKNDPRPSLIIARTHIGIGAPNKQDTAGAHGAPLGTAELALTKQTYGRDPQETFVVPAGVAEHMKGCQKRGAELEQQWTQLFEQKKSAPQVASWVAVSNGDLPAGWEAGLPVFAPEDGAKATRQASGAAINGIAAKLPFLIGGSADLAPSNNTEIKGEESWIPGRSGRNIHYGIREHAMGSIMNGLCHTPGLIPFAGTFFVFADYMRPAVRMAALMGLAPIYVMTHDSIGLGEDGPTHQPVEHLASLRAMPNLTVIRPADANETSEAWRVAISNRQGPTMLVLSRQGLPTIDRNQYVAASGVQKGGYVVSPETGELQLILLASGSEVQHAMAAQKTLQADGVGTRVVSMPSWELFEAQDVAYREQVLPAACRARVSMEAGSTFGWERYVGLQGKAIGMDEFGASAPAGELMQHFGFTADNMVAVAKQLLA
ncbi:transketolase [Desulfuromusa kysingii]|uniref:Transketolase n=1 Tax=Desulfuromusa kysingii TaxID=37625 RepID=A0A1H3VNH4_9BACT|nr:transketolase [Desulfuromusa kysingii]SDZ76346.1 transketolase [Desulfuromusa kysingii]